ncbi:ABC transporter substrate-binding protein [Aureispira anguillae]|uniref:ABC transporter substrate-binding protein n=1 Tax=Aureispira anguillae TaxID=2864201 RepID=A0A915YFV3_9BACT|nr:ABC transporter substrate-binding protein [Aureispira anguillae]BDS12277.1 ABC transporter substrate-binding protein [Aureispira anguillae]
MISKKSIHTNWSLLFVACLIFTCYSCGTDSKKNDTGQEGTSNSQNIPDDFTVRIQIGGNTDGLNVALSNSAISSEILNSNVHAALLEMNPKDFSLRPYLATGRPIIKELDDNKMSISFEIREEAVWDNGTPITAEDYAFTIKAIKNPKTNATAQRSYLEFVEEVKIDPNNPKKFTVISNTRYLLTEEVSSSVAVLPAYFYDAQGLMSDFTISELNDPANLDRLNKDPRILDFANDFNTNYSHTPKNIVGAGPYQVTEIATHQHVKLERKKEWWGDKVDVDYIAAYPQKLYFKILDDDNTAILALKEQEIDVMTYIPEEKFLDLQKNERATKNFNLYTPDNFAYRYIGFNMNQAKLSDVRVRKAIAHLIDKKHIVEDLCSNLATPINGPVSPLKKHNNKNLPEIAFNIEKAKQLLAEAGWKDMDGDNILDKNIQGQQESLKIKFLYPQGKQFYKDIAQVLKDEAARVGIEIDMIASEWSVMQEDLKKRNFDLTCLGWGQGPTLDDFKQIWHTESDTYDGNNYVGFGNQESDKLIETIRVTMDEAKRQEMYFRFQEIVADQQPYVFLVAPKLCIAINKRFKNAEASSLRPGYSARLFQLNSPK